MPNTDDLNRTIFISDNLPFLQSLDTESVDLVVIDPPFGKRQTFTGTLKPPLSKLEREQERARMDEWGVYDVSGAYELGIEYPDQSGDTALFKDIWRFERVLSADWWERIQDTPVWWLIESTRRTHGEDTAAYIAFMARRMIEIRRILRPTGSAYLHCDHEANAYLRQMMDSVFGKDNFRNEIVWRRYGSHNDAQSFGRVHDTILYYSKGRNATWNKLAKDLDAEYVRKSYRHEDERGRYRTAPLHAGGLSGGGYRYAYRGHTRTWRYPEARMRALEADGRIRQAKPGSVPERKVYLADSKGVPLSSIWDDVKALTGNHKERAGYPTQKPQALARRMIEASSNPGDIVLDCFAGCAYVPVAAEETGRRWIACDMSPRALTIVLRQFAKKPGLGMTVEGEEGDYDVANPRFEGRGVLRVRGPNRLPARTDGGADSEYPPLRPRPPEIRFRQRPLESGDQIWQAFVDEWGTDCWYCGLQQPEDRRYLQLDHVEPNRGDGTNDDCWNRALACIACNGDKSDRLTPTQTMDKALSDGRIPTQRRRDEMGDLFSARREWARERYESLPKATELAGGQAPS